MDFGQLSSHCSRILDGVAGWVSDRHFPRDEFALAGPSGLASLYTPEATLPFFRAIEVFEQLAAADGAAAFAWSVHNAGTNVICRQGSDELKERWVAGLTTGRELAGFALTEPQSGSDPANMKSRAIVQTDGSYLVNGVKAWVTLAGQADIIPTVVKLGKSPDHRDMIMLAIPTNSPGVSFGEPIHVPGLDYVPVAEMRLDGVVIPPDHLLLPEGKGLTGALRGIDIARLSIASASCGLIRRGLEFATDYAKDRDIYGRKAIDLDGLQWMFAEVATDLELARLITAKAATQIECENGPLLTAQAKLFAPEAALRSLNKCAQGLGGIGLTEASGLPRLIAQARLFRIVDGTSEVMRKIIGRHL